MWPPDWLAATSAPAAVTEQESAPAPDQLPTALLSNVTTHETAADQAANTLGMVPGTAGRRSPAPTLAVSPPAVTTGTPPNASTPTVDAGPSSIRSTPQATRTTTWPPAWLVTQTTATDPDRAPQPSAKVVATTSNLDPSSPGTPTRALVGIADRAQQCPPSEGKNATCENLPVATNAPVEYTFWNGQQLHSHRDSPIAFDVETQMIADERVIPRLAVASASDGKQNVIIHPERLGEFLDHHRDQSFVGHNVAFDFAVVNNWLTELAHPAQRVLWNVCNEGRLHDTMILDILLQLATGRYRKVNGHSNQENSKIYPANLADIASDFATSVISKEDPYRLRFSELIGLSPESMQHVDPGFFRYAIGDVVATHQAYHSMATLAHSLMVEQGFSEIASRHEIRPDAVEKFGYLSETIQVKASIALSHMFRHGVRVNREAAQETSKHYRQRIAELTDELRQRFPEVLTFDGRGEVKLTPQGQTPSVGGKKLIAMLERVAEEIRGRGEPVEIPVSKGRKGATSTSVESWQKYAHLHRFLQIWSEMTRVSKLLGFLTKLDFPTLHCRYSLLTRTGRTACSEPRDKSLPGINLQQLPKSAELRGLIVPRGPRHQLFVADFAAIELRTLGAVCRAKFGCSKLADVIEADVDPHAFTAAAIQGMAMEDFLGLRQTDPGRFRAGRQAAKAINFGVPGGLGAKALRDYAEANYGVSLSEGEAAAFRAETDEDIYPELNDRDGYLADNSMAALARTLGVEEARLWQAFDHSGQRNPIAARGVANVIRGRSTASAAYQQRVWQDMQWLIRLSPNLDPDVLAAVSTTTGSPELHDRLYHQKVATLTGRIRDGVSFTQAKNTPFQSLAADGAKLALWNLLLEGFDLYGFVHDEVIINLPPGCPEQDSSRIRGIMEASMETVLGGNPSCLRMHCQ